MHFALPFVLEIFPVMIHIDRLYVTSEMMSWASLLLLKNKTGLPGYRPTSVSVWAPFHSVVNIMETLGKVTFVDLYLQTVRLV